MSLIALTERVGTSRNVARTLLLLVVLIGAVIVGLLAMHSLNGHATAPAHHITAAHAEDISGGHTDQATVAAVDAHTQAVTGGDCSDCGTGHASMLAMACVLALFVVLLLFGRSPNATRWLHVFLRAQPLPAPRALGHSSPPSLIQLCISRT